MRFLLRVFSLRFHSDFSLDRADVARGRGPDWSRGSFDWSGRQGRCWSGCARQMRKGLGWEPKSGRSWCSGFGMRWRHSPSDAGCEVEGHVLSLPLSFIARCAMNSPPSRRALRWCDKEFWSLHRISRVCSFVGHDVDGAARCCVSRQGSCAFTSGQERMCGRQ